MKIYIITYLYCTLENNFGDTYLINFKLVIKICKINQTCINVPSYCSQIKIIYADVKLMKNTFRLYL